MYVDKSRTYIGVVEDNNDPKKLGRCRVRVLDMFDDIPKEDLPWATPWKDVNGNQFILPEVGKVLTVIFDSGNIYKPEYIYAEHFNINLENKLRSLEGSDYTSMRALMFDNKTQIYVNDSEGLKLDHKFNNINIKENQININLKDNFGIINIGDQTANQQALLGNHWLDWFDEFVEILLSGPYLGNLGALVIANPNFVQVLGKYQALRDPVFLSNHVNIVDNNQINSVKIDTSRQNSNQSGDAWKSTIQENAITLGEIQFEPRDGTIDQKKPDDPSYVAPPTDGSPENFTQNEQEGTKLPDSNLNSNQKVNKLVQFLKYKGYEIFTKKFELNIVALRNKDNGVVTNKFDEKMYVFFRNEKDNVILIEYDMTTVPGFKPQTTTLPDRVAVMKLGQYVNAYKIGNHQNKSNHPCLKFAKTKHHRNSNPSKYIFTSPVEEGAVGLNIHRSGNPQGNSVFNWSEGCQVFKSYSGWEQFMSLCRKQVSAAGKDVFTYTLCSKTEFDNFIPN